MQIPENIRSVKEGLKNRKCPTIACDIDDTISLTGLAYMRLLLEVFGNPENLTPQEMWNRYGRKDVPYWDMVEVRSFCDLYINSSEFHSGFDVVQSAWENIYQIDTLIPVGLYLTIRTECLQECTRRWIERHGFPCAPIIAMPNDILHSDGLRWKARVLEYLYPEVVGIIDDRKELLDVLSSDYQGMVFLYGHTEKHPHPRNIPSPNWHSLPEIVEDYISIRSRL